MSMQPVVVHGWTLFAHPLFLSQVQALAKQVEALQQKDPVGYLNKNATKRLHAITKLAFDIIPQDPTRAEYRQGNTLVGSTSIGFEPSSFSNTGCFSGTTRQAKSSCWRA